jgi:hypothetical protein
MGREADRGLERLRCQVLVHVRQGAGRIPAQQPSKSLAAIPRDHRLQHVAPAVGTVEVAREVIAPVSKRPIWLVDAA